MTFLPIVARELRVSSRKPGTYWRRLSAALAAILVAAFAWLILMRASPRETGYWLFVWLSVIAYAYCLLTGFLVTADCLSEEKREGTLGLLFLTDLKGYDVVLGKLFATSLNAVYGLLAIFPVLGIALLMGGVAPAEFWRVILVCVNNLFFSLSLGILASALCKDERKAMALAFLILLLLTVGLPALGGWAAWKFKMREPIAAFFLPSPGFSAFLAFDFWQKQAATTKFNQFYSSIATVHVLSWVALGLACWTVPRSWQDRAEGTARQRTRQRWTFGLPEARAAFRRHLLEINPFYWLAARDRFKTILVWVWLFAVAVVWMIGLIKSPNDWREEGAYIMTALALHTFFKVWIAMEASKRFGADRRSGALELLLSTPLKVSAILKGQWLALARQFGAAVLLVCAVDVLFLLAGWRKAYSDRDTWTLIWVAGTLVFLLDAIVLVWVSMWLGLVNRKSSQASLGALFRICGLPWMAYLGAIALFAVLDELRIYRMGNVEENFLVLLWFGFSVAIAVFFGMRAFHRLHRDFRLVATQRYESRAAVWGRWLGRKVAGRKGNQITDH